MGNMCDFYSKFCHRNSIYYGNSVQNPFVCTLGWIAARLRFLSFFYFSDDELASPRRSHGNRLMQMCSNDMIAVITVIFWSQLMICNAGRSQWNHYRAEIFIFNVRHICWKTLNRPTDLLRSSQTDLLISFFVILNGRSCRLQLVPSCAFSVTVQRSSCPVQLTWDLCEGHEHADPQSSVLAVWIMEEERDVHRSWSYRWE